MSHARIRGLYLVSEDYHGPEFFTIVEKAIDGGIDVFQYRDKTNDYDTRRKVAIRVRDMCRDHGIPFFVDDDVRLAADVGADGVHIGKDDMPLPECRKTFGGLIGYSTYGDRSLAVFAEENGADYVAFGPFFHTDTKKDAGIYDISVLENIHDYVSIPVFVIGGINLSNIPMFSKYDIDGIAVVSAIFSSIDPMRSAAELKEAMKRYLPRAAGI